MTHGRPLLRCVERNSQLRCVEENTPIFEESLRRVTLYDQHLFLLEYTQENVPLCARVDLSLRAALLKLALDVCRPPSLGAAEGDLVTARTGMAVSVM